ncbi:MAG TPA: FUSC family protein [bacterium]|nr:FUSC family protein [bacterium]
MTRTGRSARNKVSLAWFTRSLRTAVAATGSLRAAELLRLPEAFWAAVTAVIIMQSTLGATWTVSLQRFAGTVVGAVLGALGTYFGVKAPMRAVPAKGANG